MNMFEYKMVSVNELQELFHKNDLDIEINTPDGYQKIISWWNKGDLPLVSITLENGFSTTCAHAHLLERGSGGWVLAIELSIGEEILTEKGISRVVKIDNGGVQPCFDFEVDHPNHRYWGDGISSHNSGKSLIVSGNVVRNALADGVSVVLMDTENAVKKKWAEDMGVPTEHENLIRWAKTTINQVAKTISDFMEDYMENVAKLSREEQPPVLFVLDSLGNLLTDTNIEQFKDGDLKGDKGLFAKQIKALFKSTMGLFEGYQTGLVCTNHTYTNQNMYSDHEDIISGGCLVAGTQVLLSNGEKKAIEKMEIGDVVKTMHGDQKVISLWKFEKETVEFNLSDGQIIKCSPEHKFLISSDPDIWKTAKNLEEGDEILGLQVGKITKSLKILKKTSSPVLQKVYDIEVENKHHYLIGNDIVSHNSGQIFLSDIVVSMNKKKLKTDTDGNKTTKIQGIESTLKCVKSRYAKPFEEVNVQIPYDRGMDPYSGLFDMMFNKKVFTKDGNRYLYLSKESSKEYKLFKKEMNPEFFDMVMREYDDSAEPVGINELEIEEDVE